MGWQSMTVSETGTESASKEEPYGVLPPSGTCRNWGREQLESSWEAGRQAPLCSTGTAVRATCGDLENYSAACTSRKTTFRPDAAGVSGLCCLRVRGHRPRRPS